MGIEPSYFINKDIQFEEAIFNLELGYVALYQLGFFDFKQQKLTLANLGKKECIGRIMLSR